MKSMKFPSATVIERWPWAVRALLGFGAACLAVGLTYSIEPLRAFPLLLAFPTVILSAWFFGMWGGVACGLTEAILVDTLLTKTQFRISIGYAREELRLTVFLTISILLGWTIRRLAKLRAQSETRELQQRLDLANAERQLAEERVLASETLRDRDQLLQLALQANGMGLWVWDLLEDKFQWSDEVYRMAGLEPGAIESTYAAWLRLVHPDDVDGLNEATGRTRDDGADYRTQYRVMWPDGSMRWLEAQGKCQLNREGRATRVLGVVADVTHRKRADEAMLRAEKLAIAGRLAASVAHEINNPLEAVANLLFLITLGEATEDIHAHARLAMDELMRVSKITQQTLKFSRQQGMLKAIRLSEVVEIVVGVFRSKLAKTQIDLDVRAAHEVSVMCVPGEIQQIFANLMSNAIDAMPQGGRLVIRLRPSHDWRDGKTAGMRVTFCDSGMGMDRNTMRKLSEPFFTTKAETGTGLGMWVVAQLLDRHHGHMRVWSRQHAEASGTAFSLFLPLEGAEATTGAGNP
jgi:PAS domain S-box-containing protein